MAVKGTDAELPQIASLRSQDALCVQFKATGAGAGWRKPAPPLVVHGADAEVASWNCSVSRHGRIDGSTVRLGSAFDYVVTMHARQTRYRGFTCVRVGDQHPVVLQLLDAERGRRRGPEQEMDINTAWNAARSMRTGGRGLGEPPASFCTGSPACPCQA